MKTDIKKIVLTGGPCAGKTSVVELLKQELAGQVLFAPEVATMLLSGGFPLPGRDLAWSLDWQASFQQAVITTQLSLEEVYEITAQQKGIKTIVFDRGLLDSAAYLPGRQKQLTSDFGLDCGLALKRYHQVIHLESLAVSAPGLYGQTGNESRFESLEQAANLDSAIKEAWTGHENHLLVTGSDLVKKQLVVAQAISKSLL